MFNHQINRVTYPRMERQDLTQGQLGAFKFTPTDEVRPVFTEPSPFWTKPFYPLHTNKSAPVQSSPQKVQSALHSSTDSNSTSSFHYSPVSPNRSDHSFFDRQIKPDLENSRLRLGPNAVRAAVDGMASPTGKDQQWDHAVFRRTLDPKTNQANNLLVENDRHENSLKLDPSAPAFSRASSRVLEENHTLNKSLVRALATEQEAHQATKALLETEVSARMKAEADANSLREHNWSLLGSVNMLKSVVQHNMRQEREREEQAACQQFREGVRVREAEPEPTLLHDAVQNLRQPEKVESQPQPPETPDQSFDLTIPDTPEFASLRRHFSDSAELVANTSVDCSNDDGQLIQITPEKPRRGEKSDDTWESAVATSSKSSTETANGDGFVLLKKKSELKPIPLAGPYDTSVKWTGEPVFDDEQDKINRLGLHASRILPEFYKYPVRYLPRISDKNLYRTVMIDFLQPGTTYKDILQNIRGGAVESIQLYDPVGASTDFLTARVVFNYELGARGVYMQGQSPGIIIQGQRVRVWQVLEPTYPRSQALEKDIFEENFTRFLLVEHAPDGALEKLPAKLAYQMKAGFVVEITESHDGLPMVEFTSISECAKALNLLLNDPDFSSANFDFEADPCDEPY